MSCVRRTSTMSRKPREIAVERDSSPIALSRRNSGRSDFHVHRPAFDSGRFGTTAMTLCRERRR